MTYYLYAGPGGHPDITTYELNEELFPGHTLIETSEEPIFLPGTKYVDGQWINEDPTPQYVYDRKTAYPTFGDQLDMLWHAMDDGLIPKIEPLYSEIKAVKEAHPKTETPKIE